MIKYGIYISFDKVSETIIQATQKELISKIKDLPPFPKMRPHITLLIFNSSEHNKVLDIFKTINQHSFTLSLNHIDSFAGKNNVIFIKPETSLELNTLQELVYNKFIEFPHTHSSLPLNWKPHCTLNKRMSLRVLEEVKSYFKTIYKPITARIEKIELINVYHPLEILASNVLY